MAIQNAIFPAVQLSNWVKHTRDLSTITARWNDVLPDFYRDAPASAWGLQIAPAGYVTIGQRFQCCGIAHIQLWEMARSEAIA